MNMIKHTRLTPLNSRTVKFYSEIKQVFVKHECPRRQQDQIVYTKPNSHCQGHKVIDSCVISYIYSEQTKSPSGKPVGDLKLQVAELMLFLVHFIFIDI